MADDSKFPLTGCSLHEEIRQRNYSVKYTLHLNTQQDCYWQKIYQSQFGTKNMKYIFI